MINRAHLGDALEQLVHQYVDVISYRKQQISYDQTCNSSKGMIAHYDSRSASGNSVSIFLGEGVVYTDEIQGFRN